MCLKVIGGRLEKPTDCPEDLYKLMLHCWAEKPEDRPNFAAVLATLLTMSTSDDEHVEEVTAQSNMYNTYNN